MKTMHASAALAALLMTGTVMASDAARDHRRGPRFEARLEGAEEVPPVETATSGKGEIVFDADLTKAEYELTVRRGVRVTQSHIHCGPRGANGPIVVFLAGFHNRGWDVDGSWIENATVTDANVIPPAPGGVCTHTINTLADLVAAIRAGEAYVNVHTVANPGGEVRGQLRRDRSSSEQESEER